DLLEQDAAQQNYLRLQNAAQAAQAAGQWHTVHAESLRLVNSAFARSADFLMLALAMIALEDRPENVAQVLDKVPPTDISTISKVDARQLLDYLSEAGHWVLTDRYVKPLRSAARWY